MIRLPREDGDTSPVSKMMVLNKKKRPMNNVQKSITVGN
jgi:hypothetical protein